MGVKIVACLIHIFSIYSFSNERSKSPTAKDSHRTSIKDKKFIKNDIESDEDNDKMSSSSSNKRTSSRLDKKSK